MSSKKNCCYTILLLCIFAATCYQVTSLSSSDDESMYMKHEKWMAQHELYYENEEVKEKRFRIFKDNVQHIERFNLEGNHTYKLGINKFADLTNEEFLAKYAGNPMPSFKVSSSHQSSFAYKNVKDVPPSLDWRDHNVVTPVQNQGSCGCCWAFSAVAAIEGIVAIRSGKLVPLSEQHILDCNYNGFGCTGAIMEYAFDFVIQNEGLASDTDYPYTMTQGACTNNKPSSLSSKISGIGVVPNYDEAALLAAVVDQPISVGIDPKLFQFYHSGVLTGECGTDLTHAVTVVGYGQSEDGIEFWLLKNSWGAGWGDGGYVKLQRNVNDIAGMCGITLYATYPIA